jgi:hypothetical protein
MMRATEPGGSTIWLVLAALAGCSTSASVDDEVVRYNDAAYTYNELREDVLAMPPGTAIDMPTVGSATYEGKAVLRLDVADMALVGDARITADFTDGTMSGSLGRFAGTVGGADYGDFSGSIAIRDGAIGVASASGLTADITGHLTNGEDRISIVGGIIGDFRSDGIINAAGLTARDAADTTVVINGMERDADLGIVAIR